MRATSTKTIIAACSLFTAGASANTISIGLDPVITPIAGGSYDWAYTASFVNSYIQSNESRIVIFDFAGYLPGYEVTPTGWTFSTVATGPAPLAAAAALIVPSHSDTSLLNLLWDYTGTSMLMPNGSTLQFGARSMYGNSVQNSYGSRDRGIRGTENSNSAAQGPTMVPTAQVPDGGSTATLAGLGLAILCFMSKRFRALVPSQAT